MANVTYFLKKPANADGSQLIVLRLNYGYRRFSYSAGENIFPEQWDKKAYRANSKHPNQKTLNEYLEKLAAKAKDAYLTLKTSGQPITNKALRAKLEGQTAQNAGKYNLLSFAAAYREENRHAHYSNLHKHLKEFFRRHKMGADFEEIDYTFYRKFEGYLLSLKLSDNYTSRLLKALKTIVREAIRRKLTTNNEILEIKAAITEYSPDMVYLTLAELKQFYECKFKEKRHARARDLLIAACLTGLRQSDWHKLNSNSPIVIRNIPFVEIPATQKTGQRVFVPLLKFTKKILERNGGQMPELSQQKTNDHVKEAAREAGIKGEVAHRKRRGGKVVVEVIEKWEAISTHTGRRSFAAYLRDAGMPDYLIKLLMGHASKDITSRYDKRTFERVAESIVPYLEDIENGLSGGDIRMTFF